jgi:PAS domain S-box-containing protein
MSDAPVAESGAQTVPLRALCIEDNPADAALYLHELQKAGFEVRGDVVETAEELVERVRAGSYEVVLADYRLPGWTGLDAVEILRREGQDLPTILVTGAMGSEAAVECLKQGIADYVLKDRLARLPVAVRRALEERELRLAHRQAEEALRRSEAHHRSLIQGAAYAIFRSSPSEDRFLEVNPALVEMLGYDSEAELLAVKLSRDVCLERGGPGRLSQRDWNCTRVAEAEAQWKRKDGTPITVRIKERQVLDEHGDGACIEGIAENITERKRAEQRIVQLNRLYALSSHVNQATVRIRQPEALFQEMCRIAVELGLFQMAWVGLAEGSVGWVKPVAHAGAEDGYLENIRISAADMPAGNGPTGTALRQGKHSICDDLREDPSRLPWREEALRRNYRGVGAFPIQLQGRTIGALTVYASAPGFFDPETVALLDELVASVSFALENMSLEEQLQRQNRELEIQNRRVREANRMKSEFLASMSHELRSPLNGIIGFTELLYDGKLGPVSAEHKEYLNDILTSGRHLLRLINDVLDLAKVEAGRIEFQPQPVVLDKLVGEVTEVLGAVAANKQIRLETEVAADLGEVLVDPSRLKQVLYNYLSNALKFTPREGRITVRVKPEGPDHFRLEVGDTGVGIQPDDIKRLFLEFQRPDSSEVRAEQGAGLGLAVTRRLVEAQGGSVGVASTPGKGSVFHAILPRTIPAARVPTTILVVDDDRVASTALSRFLRRAGYAVETAFSGANTIAKCQSRTFAAITLDLFLPDASGWEVLHNIRSLTRNSQTPVIVVSMVREKEAGSAFPIHDFITKPVRAQELLASLDRAGVRPSRPPGSRNCSAQSLVKASADPNQRTLA